MYLFQMNNNYVILKKLQDIRITDLLVSNW